MKAISLWQPWASLWCSQRKVHETRHWRCPHRGWLLVHAAKRFEKDFGPDDPLRLILDNEFGDNWGKDLPTGALIGIVNVVDCQPTQMPFGDAAASDDDRECGDFAPGWFAWKRDEFRLFDQPIPFRGAQGIFNVPDDLIPQNPARFFGGNVPAKENKTQTDLIALLMRELRKHPECDQVVRVEIIQRVRSALHHPNWDVVWTVGGNQILCPAALRIASELQGKFDLA